jgi:hypothetical protein
MIRSVYEVPRDLTNGRGEPLNLAPINPQAFSIELVRARTAQQITTPVVLEPGDSTRYTLLLFPMGSLLWVVRTETSGFPNADAIGAAPFPGGMPVTPHMAMPLARGNEWTALVLAAFLTLVLEDTE